MIIEETFTGNISFEHKPSTLLQSERITLMIEVNQTYSSDDEYLMIYPHVKTVWRKATLEDFRKYKIPYVINLNEETNEPTK